MSTTPEQVIASAVLNELVSRFVGPAVSSLSAGLGSAFSRLRASVPRSFEQYLAETAQTVSRTRTLLSGDREVQISDIYVTPRLVNREGQVLVNTSPQALFESVNGSILLRGTGGSGKSFFMRSLFLQCIQESLGLPVFLELRKLDVMADAPGVLQKAIVRALGLEKEPEARRIVAGLLDHGHIILLLDGLDEMPKDAVSVFEEELAQVNARYPNVVIVVSTRPGTAFRRPWRFKEVSLAELSPTEVEQVVSKLDYNAELKAAFINEVTTGRQSHQLSSMMKTPLMVLVVLLTFQESTGLPDKTYLMYSHAYEALSRRHDATKTGYQRESRSGLPVDEFRQLVAAASLVLYKKNRHTFTADEFAAAINQGSHLSRIEANPEHVLEDLVRNMCLLVQDGLSYTYVHRSFQEYLTALFVRDAEPTQRAVLLDIVRARIATDKVVAMLWEMDRSLVEAEVVIPELEAFAQIVDSGAGPVQQYRGFLRALGLYIRFSALSLASVINVSSTTGCLVEHAEADPDVLWFVISRYGEIEGLDSLAMPIRNVPDMASVLREYCETEGLPESRVVGEPLLLYKILNDKNFDIIAAYLPRSYQPDVAQELLQIGHRLNDGRAEQQRAFDRLMEGGRK